MATSTFIESSQVPAVKYSNDPSDPFFLHHADSPGMTLVSQLLNGENYPSWSRSVLKALSAKNKVCFINGSIGKPPASEPEQLRIWTRDNVIVVSWLLNSVEKDIAASLIYTDLVAAHIWQDLKDRYQQGNNPRMYELRLSLMNLRQGNDSVGVYFTKLKTLWEELLNYRLFCTCSSCSCGGVKEMFVFSQSEHVMTFLMGLHESFSQVRSQILLMDPLPSINKVFSLVVQEEKQRSIVGAATTNFDSSATFAMPKNVLRTTSDSSVTRNSKRSFCTHCHASGHTIDKCYKIHGFPPGFKSKPRSVQSKSHEPAMSSNSAPSVQSLSPAQCQQLLALLSSQASVSVRDHPCPV